VLGISPQLDEGLIQRRRSLVCGRRHDASGYHEKLQETDPPIEHLPGARPTEWRLRFLSALLLQQLVTRLVVAPLSRARERRRRAWERWQGARTAHPDELSQFTFNSIVRELDVPVAEKEHETLPLAMERSLRL